MIGGNVRIEGNERKKRKCQKNGRKERINEDNVMLFIILLKVSITFHRQLKTIS